MEIREENKEQAETKAQTEMKPCPKCGKDIPEKWFFHKECGWRETTEEQKVTSLVGKSKIEVFTSPTCPHCAGAVRLAREIGKQRNDVRVVETSTATKQGQKRAQQLGVMAVPTLFVRGPGYPSNIGFKGLPPKKSVLKAIDISLGLAEWEEKKGVFKSLLEKLPMKIKW